MNTFLALIMALSVSLSGAPIDTQTSQAPSQASTQALSEAPSQAPVSAQCEEDEACWDCDTMGNTHCSNPDLGDAWESFDALDIDLDGPSGGLYIDYVQKLDRMPLDTPQGQFVIPSANIKGTYYVFEYRELAKA